MWWVLRQFTTVTSSPTASLSCHDRTITATISTAIAPPVTSPAPPATAPLATRYTAPATSGTRTRARSHTGWRNSVGPSCAGGGVVTVATLTTVRPVAFPGPA